MLVGNNVYHGLLYDTNLKKANISIHSGGGLHIFSGFRMFRRLRNLPRHYLDLHIHKP